MTPFIVGFITGAVILIGFGSYLRKATPKRVAPARREEVWPGTPPERKDLYLSAVQLVIGTENTSNVRLYNFLWGASIMILAWATIFAAERHNQGTSVVLLGLSTVGLILSVWWAPLGSRTRRYLDTYIKVARALEQPNPNSKGPNVANEPNGPVKAGHKTPFLDIEDRFRAAHLSVWVPVLFAVTFWGLAAISARILLYP